MIGCFATAIGPLIDLGVDYRTKDEALLALERSNVERIAVRDGASRWLHGETHPAMDAFKEERGEGDHATKGRPDSTIAERVEDDVLWVLRGLALTGRPNVSDSLSVGPAGIKPAEARGWCHERMERDRRFPASIFEDLLRGLFAPLNEINAPRQ
jgi:hypothetical protein